jgi:copper chaperone NosL
MWEASNMKISRNKNIVPTDKSNQRMKHDFIRCSALGRISIRWKNFSLFFLFIGLSFFASLGCGSEIKPVDIYPEDMCSYCRMAISDQRFAAQIITGSDEVFKFDDLGCMERFKEKSSDLKIAATFVKDYETKNWILYERSMIVSTSLKTPMSSGKVALADSVRAKEFLEKFPANEK